MHASAYDLGAASRFISKCPLLNVPAILEELGESYVQCVITADNIIHSNNWCDFYPHRPTEKLSVAWKRNGIKITSGVSSFGRHLAIANPTSADIGMYVCEAHLRGIAAAEPERAKAFLSILGNAPFS